jgi:hypothetical protein
MAQTEKWAAEPIKNLLNGKLARRRSKSARKTGLRPNKHFDVIDSCQLPCRLTN